MRQLLILISTVIVIAANAQNKTKKVFKRTEYISGIFYREIFDTIDISSEKLDIYFFKNHFFIPYYLPARFIDKRYKNQTISTWAFPQNAKDYQKNWEDTYTYDGFSRVIRFTYSSCFVCNSVPYNYVVTYNAKGQVYAITNTVNHLGAYKFYYNNNGDIEKFENTSFGKLETLITLVN